MENLPTILGLMGGIGLATTIVMNMICTKEKPFTSKWFLSLITFIPEEDM